MDIESSELYFTSSKKIIVAKSLLVKVIDYCKIKKFKILNEFEGSILHDTFVSHPLYKKGYKKNTSS